MNKPLIIVTGTNGQLGWSLQKLLAAYNQYNFLFVTREQLDLSKPETIAAFIQQHQPKYFINCAAYTAVDKAETEQELALQINATSVGEMAKVCAAIGAFFITISTDYVFDGNGTSPYKTNHPTNPINYYGYSKWLGEKLALENNPETIIIRTSWVYSEHGNNFVKTMLRLMKERTAINVVSDQIGCPTYAPDLAKAIMQIVEQLPDNKHSGIYHFSNTGNISWHTFAATIKEFAEFSCTVNAIPTSAFPTPAKRPVYSVMDTTAIAKDFSITITDWKESLKICIDNLMHV
ncbi:MAG: dTDP-4-dehydrorhamnose reductase [Chitinophagaceae bacterium]|nr:dTDP-4-dehydrorhamnose reductase [Chitinophagaceae bacterium]MCW5905635.1 dTDP-4-dehydrorhamnose reductase [Chitinophagaceae bacterium]